MNGADDDIFFSRARIEMPCDGVFAIAMTLLVLELKVPALPRSASSSEILHALGERGLAVARRQQLLAGDAGRARAFGFVIALHPLSFALSLLLAVVMPGQAIQVLAFTQAAIPLTARRRMRRGVPAPWPALP